MHREQLIHATVTMVTTAALMGSVTVAHAQAQGAEDRARAAALAAHPGTVLETELDRYSGRTAYEFKIRPQNGAPSIDVHVDATTGVVIGTGEDTEPDYDDRQHRDAG